MLDILIKNGTVVDGTGAPAFRADLGIAGGKVALVGNEIEREAACVLDASGLCVAPGFIDAHTHSDLTLLADPLAQSKIRQGVTTEVIGNCGGGPAPVSGPAVAVARREASRLNVALSWRTMGEYIHALRTRHSAVNLVPLAGHTNVRTSVLGYEDVQPTAEQQKSMEDMLAEAMQEGARGLSTGLYYPPAYFAKTEEVIGLARVAARYGGVYTSHIRSEDSLLLEAVSEAIEIGERSGAFVEISHVKVSGSANWQKLDLLLELLDSAAARGIRFGCDQYPYAACFTDLACILPYWARAGTHEDVARRLADPAVRAALREDALRHPAAWQERRRTQEWSGVLIADFAERPDLLGKSVAEIAAERAGEPLETAFALLVESGAKASCVYFDQDEDNVRTLLRQATVVVGSDGDAVSPEGILGVARGHPRNYGTFPRILGRYVREERVLSLEQAVQKMTSTTARRFGLAGRGEVRAGAWADLALFDPATVIDNATFVTPQQYPTGIPYVIVNGELVIEEGRHSGALPGQVL